MKKYLPIFILTMIIYSCKKDDPVDVPEDTPEENTCSVNFGGDYEVELQSTHIVQGSTYSDTTFVDTLTIVHENGLVTVQSWEIPQDSVCSEQVYHESIGGPAWIYIQFYGDSIYYQNRFGSLYTYTHNTRYGRKI